MRGWICCLAAIGGCMGLTGCGVSGPGPAGVVEQHVLAQADLEYVWDLPLDLDADETLVRLWRLDEKLYCLTSSNRLIAVDASNGVIQWWFDAGPPSHGLFRPCHVDGMQLTEEPLPMRAINEPEAAPVPERFDAVAFNTAMRAVVLDRASGKLYRAIDLGAMGIAASTGGACDGFSFYVGSTEGYYHGIRLPEAVKDWTLATRSDLLSAPVECFSQRVYVGGSDGYFYCTRIADTGGKLWTQKLGGPVVAAFHVDRRGCFVPSKFGNIYAFDPYAGTELWDQPFGCNGQLARPIQVGRATLFQYAADDGLYAVDVANGRKRWKLPAGRKILATIDGNVYVLDADRNLRVVDEMLGEEQAMFGLTGLDLFAGNVTAPAVFAATRGGHLYCIRKEDAGYLSPELLRRGPAD